MEIKNMKFIAILASVLLAVSAVALPVNRPGYSVSPATVTGFPINSSPTIQVVNSGGIYYLNVIPGTVSAASANGFSWDVPMLYGGGSWSFGYTGYIPDTVLQYVGPDGNAFFMFTPEGMFCDNLGFSDGEGTGIGLGTNNFSRPTFIGSFVNPTGAPTNTTVPVTWMKVTVGGVAGYFPVYQ